MSDRPAGPATTSRAKEVLARLWSVDGMAEHVARDWPGRDTGEAAVLYWRAKLVTYACGLIASAIVVASVVAYLLGYRSGTPRWFAFGAAIGMGRLAVLQAFRLWLLFKIGGWSRRHGDPVRRSEQPLKFWTWATASSGIMATEGAVTGYLVWLALYRF